MWRRSWHACLGIGVALAIADSAIGAKNSQAIPSDVIRVSGADGGTRAPVITHVSLHPGGRLLALAGDDHVVRLWDLRAGAVVHELRRHRDWVGAVAFSPDGRLLATGGRDKSVILWSVASGEVIAEWVGAAAVADLRFNHAGNLLAVVGFVNELRLYDVIGRKLERILRCACRDTRCLAFSPDDQRLAAGGRNGRLRIWDLAEGKTLLTVQAHHQRIRALTFDQTGEQLITAGEDRTVRVWDVETGTPLRRLGGAPGKILSLSLLPGNRIATACSDNVIRIWDLNSQQLLTQLQGHTGSVTTLDANSSLLVSGSFDTTVRTWRLDEIERKVAAIPGSQPEPGDSLESDGSTKQTSVNRNR